MSFRRGSGRTGMTTHMLETTEAEIAYDVRGPLPTADGRPPLFMIGQPMTASGFETLASYFPDRTVVTYDPRGLGRSIRKDGRVDNDPTVQADDVHARHRGARRRPRRDVREQWRRGDGARARGGLSRRRNDPGGPRAATHPSAPRRRCGRARPRRLPRRVRGLGFGRRHGGLHRDDVVAR